ncbi:TPA: hypothetical protein ACF35D_004462, partial [Escherichia coli]
HLFLLLKKDKRLPNMMATVAAFSPEFIQADTCSTLVLSHSCLLVRKCEHLHFFHLFFMIMRGVVMRPFSPRPVSTLYRALRSRRWNAVCAVLKSVSG